MTPPTQHDLTLAAAVLEAAAKKCEERNISILSIEQLNGSAFSIQDAATKSCAEHCAAAIRNIDLSALVAAHGNPTPQDARDVQRSATVGPCEDGKAELIDELYRSAKQLEAQALINADALCRIARYAKNIEEEIANAWIEAHGFDKHGAAEFIRGCRLKNTNQPNSHGTTVESAPSATASEGLAGEPVAPTHWKDALLSAVAAIYFADSSDYESALYSVVRHLAPDLLNELETDPQKTFEKAQALLTTKGETA